jgi:hypothetical protein
VRDFLQTLLAEIDELGLDPRLVQSGYRFFAAEHAPSIPQSPELCDKPELLSQRKVKFRVTFQPGQSGNPQGMRRGIKHKATKTVAALATAAGPEIARKIIASAKNGDPNAQRLFCQHLLPKPKFIAAPVAIASPANAGEAAQGVAALLPLIVSGSLDLDGAGALTQAMQAYIAARSTTELERQIAEGRAEIAGGLRLHVSVPVAGLRSRHSRR